VVGASSSRRARGAAAPILALGLGIAVGASAVVVADGDGRGYTAPPPDDPGFDHVGTIGSFTGVYIGRGWVLSAHHVDPEGEHPFVLAGVEYAAKPGSIVRFETSPGALADLVAFEILDPPRLPPLVIAARTPAPGDDVVMIGNGWTRASEAEYWSATWGEASSREPPVHRGFERDGPHTLRWGRNRVTQVGENLVVGNTRTRSFRSMFNEDGAVEGECAAVTGDSGGAVFVREEGRWALAGILFAVSKLRGEPPHLVRFGALSDAADLAFYRESILEATGPPLPASAVVGLAFALLLGVVVLLIWRRTSSS
jgi:hypothetical protein